MVLCLSYKSKGSHKLPNVHDLVFRLPNLEYRNKTWSNLDLYNHLKKEVTRAVLAHTTTIISNVMSRHRPSKLHQSRLRDLANASIILGSKRNDNAIEGPSSSYISSMDGIDEDDNESGYVSNSPRRASFASGRTSQYSQYADEHSIVSTNSGGNGGGKAHLSGLRALTTFSGGTTPSKSTNATPSSTGNGFADHPHSPVDSLSMRPKTAASSLSSRLFGGGGGGGGRPNTPSNRLRRPSSAHSSSATQSLYATPSPPAAVALSSSQQSHQQQQQQQTAEADENDSVLGRKESSIRRGFSRVSRRLSGEANRDREKVAAVEADEDDDDDGEDDKKEK
jgi:hypothetical protein